MMQELWLEGYDWNDELSPEHEGRIRDCFSELPELENISVPRNLGLQRQDKTEIHTFVDASSLAYGTVVYARNVDNDTSKGATIVAAKSKVAPVASVSIPRLELIAAIQGLRLTKTVCKALNCK